MRYIFLILVFILIFPITAFSRNVEISWNAVAGATSYKIYWGTESGVYPNSISNITDTSRIIAIDEATTYVVLTANDGTESTASAELTIPGEYTTGNPDLLTQDGYPTPEQIAILMPDVDGTLYPSTMTATVRYRKSGGVWQTGHDLYRILSNSHNTSDPTTYPRGLAWTLTGLDQGSTYTVEVTTTDGEDIVIYTKDMTTASLPPAAGPVTTTIAAGSTEAQIEAIINSSDPGDVIQFENGTYTVNEVTFRDTSSGTDGNPVYIRGESRDGVIISDSNGNVIRLDKAQNIIIENLTIRGSGVDAGRPPTSVGIYYWGGYTGTGRTITGNVTLRNLTITGVDKGIVASTKTRGLFIYECIVEGNNSWTQDLYNYNGTVAGANGTLDIDEGSFWDDDGITLGGRGNVAFNNTVSGFGDSFAVHVDEEASASNHIYRNKILMSGDDAIETDYADRNITFYDNYIANTMTCASVDPIYGGPHMIFRNTCLNVGRQAWKINTPGEQSGMFFYNNTVVHTFPSTANGDYDEWIWTQYNTSGYLGDWGHQNNIMIYQNAPVGVGVMVNQKSLLTDPNVVDFTNNSWYPDGRIWWQSGEGTYTNLADAQANLPATLPLFSNSTQRHENDLISELQPFETSIVLGSDFFTEVTTTYTPTLSAGGVNNNSGTVITGVTDGYSGAAPDRGAIIAGRSLVTYGATVEGAPPDPPPSGRKVRIRAGQLPFTLGVTPITID